MQISVRNRLLFEIVWAHNIPRGRSEMWPLFYMEYTILSMSGKNAEHPNNTSDILLIDKTSSIKDGIFNFHNSHIWAIENPHAIHEYRSQQRLLRRILINNCLPKYWNLFSTPCISDKNCEVFSIIYFMKCVHTLVATIKG